MNRAVAALSLGGLADRAARIAGWSPVGRHIVLCEAEGRHADYFEGLLGTVTAIDDGVLVADCLGDPGRATPLTTLVRISPRHAGWTVHSLMFCRIAVTAEASGPDGATKQAVAIASVK
jgi:hypothetical protein